VTTSSGVMSNALYSFGSSTGNEPCTSPSEMLAAAVASCMSLMMAQELAKVGVRADHIKTESVLTLEEKKGHWDVAGIELNVHACLPPIDEETFHKVSRGAKANCPISRALHVPIKLTAKLEAVEYAAAV
jgi:lipoyl-dependent peroxiredoxin